MIVRVDIGFGDEMVMIDAIGVYRVEGNHELALDMVAHGFVREGSEIKNGCDTKVAVGGMMMGQVEMNGDGSRFVKTDVRAMIGERVFKLARSLANINSVAPATRYDVDDEWSGR